MGGHLRLARHWSHRLIPWRLRSSAWENQRLLQLSNWRQIRPKSSAHGSWAWNYGFCESWTFWATLQTWQLRLRTDWSWKQLGQRSLHWRSWTNRLCARCYQKVSLRLRLSSRIPNHPFIRRWNRLRNGNTTHLQSQRRVSRQNNVNLLSSPLSKSLRHCSRALQRHPFSPSVGLKRWLMHGHWQWSPLRYLFQNSQADHSNLRRSQPFGFSCHVRSYLLS